MESLQHSLYLTQLELVHYFGKTEEEAQQMVKNSKYLKNVDSCLLQAEPSTWGILFMTEQMKTT
jgi:hypothetical protein